MAERRGREKPKCQATLQLPTLSRRGVTFICAKNDNHKGEHDWQPRP